MAKRRGFPLSGYAPGNYMNICCDCKEQFEGDKRAIQCLPCAAESVNRVIESLHDRLTKREQELVEAYMELRKLYPATKAYFDREVWEKAKGHDND